MSYRQSRHSMASGIHVDQCDSDDDAHPQVAQKLGSIDNTTVRSNERDSPNEDYELENLKPDRDSTSNLDEAEWEKEDPEVSASTHAIPRRASVSTVQSFMLYTPDEERSVVRKFDRKLVLFIAALYMLSFLDRSSMQICVFFPRNMPS